MTKLDPVTSPHSSDRPPRRQPRRGKLVVYCDRCGEKMNEQNCKLTCPNCGSRLDCSDLNVHFD
jgi:hypothetical protein